MHHLISEQTVDDAQNLSATIQERQLNMPEIQVHLSMNEGRVLIDSPSIVNTFSQSDGSHESPFAVVRIDRYVDLFKEIIRGRPL